MGFVELQARYIRQEFAISPIMPPQSRLRVSEIPSSPSPQLRMPSVFLQTPNLRTEIPVTVQAGDFVDSLSLRNVRPIHRRKNLDSNRRVMRSTDQDIIN
eukprot:Tbor_TRINITY_DN6057_c3_g2::TRINITY_DN6057_c3_g2_i2::g.10820::m.10820